MKCDNALNYTGASSNITLPQQISQYIINLKIGGHPPALSNYYLIIQGHPFMVGLTANKPLMYSLLITTSVILMLATGLVPDLCEWFEIVEFPLEVSSQ